MLTKNQEKLIKSLHTKKGRDKSSLCLVEGRKNIELAEEYIDFTFTKKDTPEFSKLITTETPQDVAAVARIPNWVEEDVIAHKIVVVLDGVQDPGNVGAILRCCLGFGAGLVFVNSADPTNPKVIRSSAGAMFHVPWLHLTPAQLPKFIKSLDRSVYRLERTKKAFPIKEHILTPPLVLVAGSEGQGIQTKVKGTSIFIQHNELLESLNVGHALAIALHTIS